MIETLRKNRVRYATLAILAVLLITAVQGMEQDDWAITILRGLSVGMVTFLVAAGLSLIFGLMDVLNLAHGELFMIGAYVGWTVFVRPDTMVDLLPLVCLLTIGFVLRPLWQRVVPPLEGRNGRIGMIVGYLVAIGLFWLAWQQYSIAIWNPEVYSESPITFSLALDQGQLAGSLLPADAPSILSLLLLLLAGCAAGIASVVNGRSLQTAPLRPALIWTGSLLVAALIFFIVNTPLTTFLLTLNSTARFFLAMGVATGVGFVLGSGIETMLIRPLYDRPIYQLMMTLGISFIGIELVRAIWGRPEFTIPKPGIFDGGGAGCPAESIGDLIAFQCSTVRLLGGRIRTYNEIFIIVVGLVVLIGVWVLLQRTRLGMIIRAGVQDSEMVEALGINVRRVFTLVFALGVALASLGGILAAPSIGLSTDMGTRLLLLALIALAIGGLTSFPGAAAGAILVGLLQQFLIKYGQLGINLPFLAEPFKPSPPLVPASTVLLMVLILLLLPNGLFGRNE